MCGLPKGVMLVGSLLEKGLLGEVMDKFMEPMGSKFTCAAKNGRKGMGEAFMEHLLCTRLFCDF